MAFILVVANHRDGMAVRPALAQQRPQRSSPHVIEDRTPTEAELVRSLCPDNFRTGDTITAKLHPGSVVLAPPRWWPKLFIVTLRQAAPVTARDRALLNLVVIRATVDGVVVRNVRGAFWLDIESGTGNVPCYSRLNGFTKTIRVR